MYHFAKDTHLDSEAKTCTHVRLTWGLLPGSYPTLRLKLSSTYFIIITVLDKKERKKNCELGMW